MKWILRLLGRSDRPAQLQPIANPPVDITVVPDGAPAGNAMILGAAGANVNRRAYVRVRIDTSTSMSDVGAELGRAFNKFLDELTASWIAGGGEPKNLLVAVKVFNGKIVKLGDFVSVDQVARWNANTYDRFSARGTALYDVMSEAATSAMTHQSRHLTDDPESFFAVVVLTDGADSSSKKGPHEARRDVEDAQARGVQFRFCYVGENQAAAREGAVQMGIDEGATMTGSETALGLKQP